MLSPRTFFRASLLLPIIVPLLAWLLFKSMGTAIALMSVLMAGVPYLAFAAYMWVKLGCVPESMVVPRSVVLAPIFFLAPAGIAFMVWSGYSNGFDRYLPLSAITFLPFAFFILVFGYSYVGLTVLTFALLSRAGWIRLKPP